jgi:nicotinamide phosphoribosyltransferase
MEKQRRNILLCTDSYKISHSKMYPENMTKMFDYIEAREGGKWDELVFFGLQMFIKNTLLTPFTKNDIDEAEEFYNNHFLPMYKDQIFHKEMFEYILKEHGGYMPVRIKAVPEGMVVPVSNVLCTIESTDPKCPTIVSFLETIVIRDIWYGCTVATNSYKMKQAIRNYGLITADNLDYLPFALHDFGARGVSSGESAILGGSAHLVNFMGSDTLEAIYAAQKTYGVKEGLPGYSVVATEHSVMCSEGRDGEMKVAQRVFDAYAKDGGIIAMVNDTYDMEKHVRDFSKIFLDKYKKTGVRWVTRPDSGYPPEVVVDCLELLWEYHGGSFNSKGFRVLDPSVRLIQGDGIDIDMIDNILSDVRDARFSTENVVFGSGGGLLQKVNRDTLRFAMKASYIEVAGEGRNIFKDPATQNGNYNKKSKSGELSLYRYNGGDHQLVTWNKDTWESRKGWVHEVLVPVYENGKLLVDYSLDEVRANTCLW